MYTCDQTQPENTAFPLPCPCFIVQVSERWLTKNIKKIKVPNFMLSFHSSSYGNHKRKLVNVYFIIGWEIHQDNLPLSTV